MKERIPKLVIKAGVIKDACCGIGNDPNLILCPHCLSPLHYIKITWGVIAERDFLLGYNSSERMYSLREIGFTLYCAECGEFIEHYDKWVYPEDKIIMTMDGTDMDWDIDERAEIQNCLTQFNQKGDFKSRYKSQIFSDLKAELKKYEKKHPIKKKKQKKVK